MLHETLTTDQLKALQKVDSPTIANVIELFNVRSYVAGYSNLSLKAVYPELPSAVGYAATATFRPAYPAEAGDSYGGMPQLIADSISIQEPRIVVFQDLDEPPQAATYGEVMASTFQKFGFAGLITTALPATSSRYAAGSSLGFVGHCLSRLLPVPSGEHPHHGRTRSQA
jgi:regulator of RNase E activity RraA